MKKLKLKELKLGELLTREQMRNVVGGDYPTCPPTSCTDNSCPYNSPYCLATSCYDDKGIKHNYDGCSPTDHV